MTCFGFRRSGALPLVAGTLCAALLVALALSSSQVFSGRAVFIHIGALLGTILTANFLMRIIPAQRKIAAALAAGQPPDPALSARARLRSRHNLLLSVPVVFLMVSNHFPLVYGHANNWLILSLLVFAGAVAGKALFGRDPSRRPCPLGRFHDLQQRSAAQFFRGQPAALDGFRLADRSRIHRAQEKSSGSPCPVAASSKMSPHPAVACAACSRKLRSRSALVSSASRKNAYTAAYRVGSCAGCTSQPW